MTSHGGKRLEKPAAAESTLVASLGDSLGLVTVPVAAMTWEVGVVYKHVATDYIKFHSTCKPV